MSIPDLWQALHPVVGAFRELGIDYFIGGSVASSAYGVARSTLYIDVVADLREPQIDPLVSALQSDYYIDAGTIRRALEARASFNVIHLATMMKVDVFILKATPYDQTAFQRRRADSLVGEVSTLFSFAAPEDVILHKLGWYRLGGEVSDRQWSDVLGVLEVQRDALDMDYLRGWAERLGVSDLLHRALSAISPS
ncbi:MAG: hypothetical protein GX442_10705 [Candidatus Riflebacteria bacterium]|nr:hypothetical protein [Candidatus Riflebacteria bacterium]